MKGYRVSFLLTYFLLFSAGPEFLPFFKAIVYILPPAVSSDFWTRNYGDRIYYYAKRDISRDIAFIDQDFERISSIYQVVIPVVPADDTEVYLENLRLLNQVAGSHGLRVIYAIFPGEKYGKEQDYLTPDSPMYRLVLRDMEFLAALPFTYKIAIWFGWKENVSPGRLVFFSRSLPGFLKPYYAIWLDEEYVGEARKAMDKGLSPNTTVITEIYNYDDMARVSALYPDQIVITGYSGARNLKEWRNGIEHLLSLCRTWKVGIWIYSDRNDGSGEEFSAFINGELTNFYLPLIPPRGF